MYGGAKGKKYLMGLERWRKQLVTPRIARVTAFVKDEKMDPLAKEDPDPRLIQFRSPEYCVGLAQYLKPIEGQIYKLCGDGRVLPEGRIYGKGLNNWERARIIREKWESFARPVVCGLDMSRFDQHVSRLHLQIEHSVYLRCIHSPEFASLLRMQLRNEGATMGGVKYSADGRRMSGDMNTALGNCVLMTLFLMATMPQVHWNMFDDGDDCLLFLEETDLDMVQGLLPRRLLNMGMEVRVDVVAHNLSEIVWCQSKLIQNGRGEWLMGGNPRKFLSQICAGSRWGMSKKTDQRMFKAVGDGLLALYAGVPILQDFALLLRRLGGRSTKRVWDKNVDAYSFFRQLQGKGGRDWTALLDDAKPEVITDGARRATQEAWGITTFEQLTIESQLGSCTSVGCSDRVPVTYWDQVGWKESGVESLDIFHST